MKRKNKIREIKNKISSSCDKAFDVLEHTALGIILSSVIYLIVIKKSFGRSKCDKKE